MPPTLFPTSAEPKGHSSEILPSSGFVSVVPTIINFSLESITR